MSSSDPLQGGARWRPGVNVVGYLRAELGIGEIARLLVSAVEQTDIPFATVVYDRNTQSRQEHPFQSRGAGPEYDTNILCVNADGIGRFAEETGPDFFRDRYTIGYWAWEVEPFPATMFQGFDYVDEVWALSEYAAAPIAAVSPVPVIAMPPPLISPRYVSRSRRDLGLPEGFLLLFMFDFFSVVERKNPAGLIEAFTRAFAPGEGPLLVIKTINGDRRPEQLAALEALASRPDVILIDGYISAEDKNAMVASCDVYASLHRSEGLGLTMAEAMALGKPVIATRYSGNLTFMDEATSFLVSAHETSIPEGCAPYPAGGRWSEPDLDEAARLMRTIYESPGEARSVGERARRELLSRHSPAARAPAIRSRLKEIRGWRHAAGARASRPFPRTSVASGTEHVARPIERSPRAHLAALDRIEELLAQGPRAGGSTRFGPLGRFARRILFRTLRPYAAHQRAVARELVTGLRELQSVQRGSEATSQWLMDRLGKIQGEVGRLRAATPAALVDLAAQLTALEGDLDALRAELEQAKSRAETPGGG